MQIPEFTIEQLRMLADQEREMDAGQVPFVRLRDQRVAMTPSAMAAFGLEVGQTINDQIFIGILRLNLAECEASLVEQRAAKTDNDAFNEALAVVAREDVVPGTPEWLAQPERQQEKA